MKCSVIGFPRIGKLRELKFASEKYFRNEISQEELLNTAKELRLRHLNLMKKENIDYIPSNDFSFYDTMLDTAFLLNAIPQEYKSLNLNDLDTYFAMARGYQGKNGDCKALSMKKWFNTNYHYIVPELYDNTELKLTGTKLFDEFIEAKKNNITTKPVIVGPFTFLKLANYNGKKNINDFAADITLAYKEILKKAKSLGVSYIQFDEPILVTDLDNKDISLFNTLYKEILKEKSTIKVILQTYFGDIRDCFKDVITLDFDGIGLDFIEGFKSLELLKTYGFPKDKTLFAGIINGKNIWKCHYKNALSLLDEINKITSNIVIQPSCSLLHVPYTLDNEPNLNENVKKYFAFAQEKLTELNELKLLHSSSNLEKEAAYINNVKIFNEERIGKNEEVLKEVASLTPDDFKRTMNRKDREKLQKTVLNLPLLPTTTIGSFPQTKAVKSNRKSFRNGEISKEDYDKKIYKFIKECIKTQEEIGLDVLVHGEYERNDMVEFFGENLSGYVFTEKAWVQSYGTRCVKPPIIFGDIKRTKPITTPYIKYAQSLTKKPVKGMLTGPVTILNWSFEREDISLKEMAYQIGIAIREEVCDLENAGIKIIQIDEAALREKLPLRKADWYSKYLDYVIPAFRLCTSKVKPETQIHTHMCYSEFSDIIKAIDDMDADVISFEASKSKLSILDSLYENNFETEVGPGCYDIHSPRVPSVSEIVDTLNRILTKIDKNKVWVNPDCGLKTRGIEETVKSLKNLVAAAKIVRGNLI